MSEITIKQLMFPAATVTAIISGFIGFEARYVTADQLAELTEQVETLEQQAAVGHKESELNSKIFTATKIWLDLLGRQAMYQAKAEANIITEAEKTRWAVVNRAVNDALAELMGMQEDLAEL